VRGKLSWGVLWSPGDSLTFVTSVNSWARLSGTKSSFRSKAGLSLWLRGRVIACMCKALGSTLSTAKIKWMATRDGPTAQRRA
jgi:hypothetical protein